MTAKTLSSLVGGGGYWYDKAIIQHTVIPSGATGTLLIATCAEDERIVLTGLNPSTGVTQSGISVAFSGVNVLSDVTISASAQSASVKVGSLSDARYTVDKIEGRAGEALTISKNAGGTVENISYSYKVQGVAYV